MSVRRVSSHPVSSPRPWVGVALATLLLVGFSIPTDGADSTMAVENARPGTRSWRLSEPARSREIEGYASLTSVGLGGTIRLYVSTTDPSYRLEVFRLGWYAGLGGRRVTDAVERTGWRQVMPMADPVTGYLECDWFDPYELTVPEDGGESGEWVSGIHVAKLTAEPSGKQSYIVFVVRDDDRASDFLFQSAVVSFQAVNNWGGRSLLPSNSIGQAATRVSFARPYASSIFANAAVGVGAGELITNLRSDGNQPAAGWEINMVRWLEREGYDVTYATAVDTHRDPTLLMSHAAILSAGRDEYWTDAMHRHLEDALGAGTGLGLFAAATGDRPVRLEAADWSGEPDRTVTLLRPSASSTAVAAADGPGNDAIIERPDHWALAGTGNRQGDRLRMMGGTVSGRWFDETRRSYSTLAESVDRDTGERVAAMAAYVAPGGGLVFSAASAQWAWGLDDDGAPRIRPSARSEAVRQITRNVLARFAEARTSGPFPGPSGPSAEAGDGRIVVRWNASPRAGARYDVYRDTTDDVAATGRRINATPLDATSLVDANVVAGLRYFYVVVAVDADDWVSDLSAVVSASSLTSSTPLSAPYRVTARVDGAGAVTLQWQHATPADVSGYRVYRRAETQTASPWVLLNPSHLGVATLFVDADASAGIRSYTIEAVGIDGRVSPRTSPVRVDPSRTNDPDWLSLDIVATWHLAGAETSPEFRQETRDPYQAFPGWLFDGQQRYEIQSGEAWNGHWSFPRFGLATESLVSVRGQAVRLEANAVAGGAIAELWWEGRQFLNKWSFGRMLQMSLFLDPEATVNPTEGGDQYSAPGPVELGWVPSGWTHGSPLVALATSDGTISTVTAPLNWVPEQTPGRGGHLAQPMLWRGAFGKELQLDFAGRPNVMRWRSTVTLPSDTPFFDLEIATAYVTADFSETYDFDAEALTLTRRGAPTETCSVATPAQGGGGIVQATPDGYALGIYRRYGHLAPSQFGHCSIGQSGNADSLAYEAQKINVREVPGDGLPAGTYEFEAYIVVGSLPGVTREMEWLYLNGY